MNPEEWLRFVSETLRPLPNDYLVLDTETTGLDCSQDVILQLGWCLVQDRQVVESDGAILNWLKPDPFLIDPHWLLYRIEGARRVMLAKGNDYPWTPEVIRAGVDPLDGLADLLVRLQAHDLPAIVTHNGWAFDAPMIEKHLKRFLDHEFSFHTNQIWDTGALEKGLQLGTLPNPGDDLRSFTLRIMHRPCRIKWSLFNHCIPKYQLNTRYGLNLAEAHHAPFDARATHYLLETYRELLEGGTKECTGSNLTTHF